MIREAAAEPASRHGSRHWLLGGPTSTIEGLVHRADDECAISDSRCHSFGRVASHIPDGKDIRSGRLQKQRPAVAPPTMLGKARMAPGVVAGDDESLVVEADQATEITGPR